MSTLAIDLRPARFDDADGLATAHDETWRYAYRGIIPGRDLERMVMRRGPDWWLRAVRRNRSLLVVTVADEIAGYASFGRNRAATLPVSGEIYELYVRPEFHGIGLGRRLFAASRADLETRGMPGLAVWALRDNEDGCRFYRAAGGSETARGAETFGDVTLEKIAFTWP
ncbi:GNAT family N-acetyltransferase [Terrihabitans sp. B22-R8]|uniref:GNAT family N-acetyltransferase n=1 Tax=Terrihabitans sp. B22-R8 TaxID=3425128 RepID=UPI00403C77E5